MAQTNKTNENLKAQNFVKWTGLMNNYKHSADISLNIIVSKIV